jgi:hypothetical protein
MVSRSFSIDWKKTAVWLVYQKTGWKQPKRGNYGTGAGLTYPCL